MRAYDYIYHQQCRILFWSCFGVLCLGCLGVNYYYGDLYMRLQDRVLIVAPDGSCSLGWSYPVASDSLERDIAMRAAMIFFNRSHTEFNDMAAQAVFGRGAYEQLLQLIDAEKKLFKDRRIVQHVDIERIRIAQGDDTCVARVSGILTRTGVYMELPYRQQFKVSLGLRLVRSPDIKKYPMRVLRLKYEYEILNNSTEQGVK